MEGKVERLSFIVCIWCCGVANKSLTDASCLLLPYFIAYLDHGYCTDTIGEHVPPFGPYSYQQVFRYSMLGPNVILDLLDTPRFQNLYRWWGFLLPILTKKHLLWMRYWYDTHIVEKRLLRANISVTLMYNDERWIRRTFTRTCVVINSISYPPSANSSHFLAIALYSRLKSYWRNS